MPSRMIHYLVAEKVAKRIPIRDRNRFKIGSLCPDMASRENGNKNVTHYIEITGESKGANWVRFAEVHGTDMQEDDLYLGVFCHILTDAIWFHDIMEPQIRSRAKSYEEREVGFQKGYLDFHRLNYILPKVYGLTYELKEDRNIVLEGVQPELYDMVFDGMYQDFFAEPEATKDELVIYTCDMSIACIERCIEECVKKITAFREGRKLGDAREFYVPARIMPKGREAFGKKVIETATAYANYRWVPTEQNCFHGIDEEGRYVDTPDVTWRGDVLDCGWWKVGEENVGIPYGWGNASTLEAFEAGLREGKYAGNVPEDKSRYGSHYTVGVDCSGLLTICWGLEKKIATRDIPQYADELESLDEMRQGDVFAKVGSHVMLYKEFADEKKEWAVIIDATRSTGKVSERKVCVAELLEDGYRMFRKRELQ